MNFCSNPHSLISIELNELIGKSLNTINTNFSLLNEQICSENTFLKKFDEKRFLLEAKISSLSPELEKTPFAYCVFDGNGSVLKQKNSSIVKISTGVYQINFSLPRSNYLFSGCLTSSTGGFISSTTETSTSISITTRSQNGILFDPEKISLIFFS